MDDTAQITRETFGNIPPSSVIAFYVMAAASLSWCLAIGVFIRHLDQL